MVFTTYYRYLRNFGPFPCFTNGSKSHAFSDALSSKFNEFYLLHSFQKLHPYN